MATMKLTALAIERELNYKNQSLFDGFAYPTDPDNVFDINACNSRILMRCGEFEVLYSDPDIFRSCVNVWSTAYKRTFDKWLAAVMSDYNPIENYNMRERFQDDGHNTSDTSASGTRAVTGNNSINVETSGTDGKTINNSVEGSANKTLSNSSTGETTTTNEIDNTNSSTANGTKSHNVSAFDSSTYSPESQDISSDTASATAHEESTSTTNTETTGSGTEADTHSEEGTTTESGTHGEESTTTGHNSENVTSTDTGNREDVTQNIHVGERSGNIGVTTSQQMLEQEYRVALFSIYDRIADLFVNEFCIMVY